MTPLYRLRHSRLAWSFQRMHHDPDAAAEVAWAAVGLGMLAAVVLMAVGGMVAAWWAA